MKSTGIIRRVDELGRVVIPMEIRTQLKLKEKDPLEIYVNGPSIILKKHEESCVFCNSSSALTTYKDKIICNNCLKNISKMTL